MQTRETSPENSNSPLIIFAIFSYTTLLTIRSRVTRFCLLWYAYKYVCTTVLSKRRLLPKLSVLPFIRVLTKLNCLLIAVLRILTILFPLQTYTYWLQNL